MAAIDVNDAYVLDHTGEQVDQVTEVPYGAAGLTDAQKAQARTNLGVPAYVEDMLNRSNAVDAANAEYTTYMARGTALSSVESTPSVNGAICWLYE